MEQLAVMSRVSSTTPAGPMWAPFASGARSSSIRSMTSRRAKNSPSITASIQERRRKPFNGASGLCPTIQGTEHKRHKRHKREFKLDVLLFFLCLLCSFLVLLVLRSRFVVQIRDRPAHGVASPPRFRSCLFVFPWDKTQRIP